MNSHIWKCSQCNKYNEMNIKNDIINTYCKCGYNSTMSIKECIKDCKRNKSNNTISDYSFKDITTHIKEANEHLLSYFPILRN